MRSPPIRGARSCTSAITRSTRRATSTFALLRDHQARRWPSASIYHPVWSGTEDRKKAMTQTAPRQRLTAQAAQPKPAARTALGIAAADGQFPFPLAGRRSSFPTPPYRHLRPPARATSVRAMDAQAPRPLTVLGDRVRHAHQNQFAATVGVNLDIVVLHGEMRLETRPPLLGCGRRVRGSGDAGDPALAVSAAGARFRRPPFA